MCNEDEKQSAEQGHSSVPEVEESEMEEERDTHFNEEDIEETSAVMHTQAVYTLVDERRKNMDNVTKFADKRAHIKEEVPEVSTSTSYHEKRTISAAVAFSKQQPKADTMENTTTKTPKAPEVG